PPGAPPDPPPPLQPTLPRDGQANPAPADPRSADRVAAPSGTGRRHPALRARPSMSALDPVAVVAGHGTPDQRGGQPVRELARLLCHGGAGEPRYVQGEMHEVLVPVARLEPGVASPTETHAPVGGRKAETSRRRPGTPSGVYPGQRSTPAPSGG